MHHIFKKLTAQYFFTNYAKIPGYKHKLRGVNRHGTAIGFSDEEKRLIEQAKVKWLQEVGEERVF